MGFLNQNKYKLLIAVTIISIMFFLAKRLHVNDNFYNRMFEDRKNEHYSGIIEKKYIDNEEHNIPQLKLKDTILSMETEFWNKLSVGDSIVKIKGEDYISVFSNKKLKIVLDYSKYFNELSGKKINKPSIFYPNQQGLINDFDSIFTNDQKDELSQMLLDYNIKSKNKIIIASLDSIPTDINFQVYAEDLGRRWKIEQNNQGRTILIVFSKRNRKVALTKTNAVVNLSEDNIKSIVSKEILPDFKRDNYYLGIKKGILGIMNKWN
ncbi:hypothetical protein HYN59_15230 [Flavobacterium album]|uniref:TPM domain-containing protein n=1 Tax=Flavobacterium album TaxID=2175091 RepID=A0A2S1R175_9FLAO|nr:TPM domain-containing protein [Flavobacterium album]AWH86377.1 hypothetical protein HYN59_15230 [Flavobacterium album]